MPLVMLRALMSAVAIGGAFVALKPHGRRIMSIIKVLYI